jgi:uncharacterized protein (DUF885 family)
MAFKKERIMKPVLLICLFALTIAVLVSCQAAVNQDSASLEKLFDDYFREILTLNPERGTEMGLPRESGYEYDRAGLDDYSDAGLRANFDLARKYLQELKKIDQTKISKSQSIDAEILSWLLELQLDGEKFIDHKYYIDHLWGVHGQMTNLLTSYHSVENLQDASDYLGRMEKIPLRFRQTIQRIDSQEGKGIYPPVFIIERVITDMQDFRSVDPKENLLYADFKSKLEALKDVNPDTNQALCGRAQTIISEQIYPAYDQFLTRLKTSAAASDSLAGLWKLPNGKNYYAYALKSFTSSSMTPEEVFKLGIREVKRLQDMGRVLLDSLGISNQGSFGDMMNEYRDSLRTPENEEKFNYPEGKEARQMVLRDYRALLEEVQTRLPEVFSYIPKTPVTVEPVPEYKEQSGLTYYEPGSFDGKRKATFYINMTYVMAKPNMRSLTYHETIPGHHYQIALQQELTQNRMFKNLYFISGFGEGWAMYVEDLAAELGWLPDIYSRIAELNSQLFRAVRVVVDAGIHSQKWSKESALQYQLDNLGWNSTNEVDRYIVWPGQACSYTIGKLKIMELREKAKQEMGPKFDLKDFHMTILENGSLPLDLLEEIVDNYIAASK